MKLVATALAATMLSAALGACAAAVVGAGAAAADYYVDDNDVCDGPNDVGFIDSDCD